MQKIELVEDYCPHDCMYRGILLGFGGMAFCNYAVATNTHTRGCSVSKCDKYRAGERIKPKMTTEYIIEWEYDIYDNDYTMR